MNEKLSEEIRLSIEKNLPSQVGETLKDVLQQAKKDAEHVVNLQANLKRLEEVIKRKEQAIMELSEREGKASQILSREEEVEKRERNQRIFELETQLKAEQRLNSDLNNFVGMVFKSPVYRRTIQGNDFYTSMWDNTQNRLVKSGSSVSETVEQD